MYDKMKIKKKLPGITHFFENIPSSYVPIDSQW